MTHPTFFRRPSPMTVAEIASLTKAELRDPAHGDRPIIGLAALQEAGPRHIAFFDNLKYADDAAATVAGACFVAPKFANRIPDGTIVLKVARPFVAFVTLAQHWHQDALRPASGFDMTGIAASAVVHPDADLEDEVTVDPLAVIGPDAEIGSGTIVGSGAVIGPGVRIGRDCNIGAGTTIHHAMIGNNVLIHPGCHIGQDGFGFLPGPRGWTKVPQTGRVIIQHNVEIGAGTTIDRGSLRDTVIGEGSKLDNQVQVGHNVVIGRHTVIAAQCGLAGSLTIGNNVVIGAKVGLNNHIEIGDGAMIAAMSGVKDSVPAGQRWGGYFARPSGQWFREILALEKLGRRGATKESGKDAS